MSRNAKLWNTDNSIVLSIKQKYADAILNGTKHIEVRRRQLPDRITKGKSRRIFIYASAPVGKVIGEMNIRYAGLMLDWTPEIGRLANLTRQEWIDYQEDRAGLHIYEIIRTVKTDEYTIQAFGIRKAPQFYAAAKMIPEGLA